MKRNINRETDWKEASPKVNEKKKKKKKKKKKREGERK